MDAERWREIRAVFGELVELEADQRAERLAAIGKSDAELHDAVVSLLAADAENSGRLGGAALPPRGTRSTGPAPDPFGLTGQILSHFRVLDPLEAGGMGMVYRAEDTRLHRTVALKFLLPQYHLDSSAKERFLHEARSAAALDHPNLCTVYEVGESEDGRLFLAMALYPGETLKARLTRQGPLPVEEALEITRQVARGLSRAHEAGIVHRDLKPGNLMLLLDGMVKILDFGLAKARDLSLTGSGATLGTVAYMAPEQVRGEAVDGRSDLWALGVVLYEMLTGRRPFGGGEERSIVHAILHQEPVPPSELGAEIPPELEEVVLTLLQKDPARRYASAGELLEALAEIQPERTPLSTGRRPGRLRHVARRWSRLGRRRAVIGAAAAGALLLAAGVGLTVQEIRRSGGAEVPIERSVAVLPFVDMSTEEDQEYFSDGIAEELLNALAQVEGLRVAARTSSFSFRGENVPVDSVGRALKVANVLEGSIRKSGNRIQITVHLVNARDDYTLWSNSYDRELTDIFEVQDEIARAIAQTLQVKLAGANGGTLVRQATSDPVAYQQYLHGQYLRQRSDDEAAIAYFEQAIARDPQFALAYAALSRVVAGRPARDRRVSVQEAMERSRWAAQRALELDSLLPDAHVAAGFVRRYYDLEWAAAERSFLRATQLNANHVDAYHGLRLIWQLLDQPEKALAAARRAVEMDPVNPYAACAQAWTNHFVRRYDDALRYFQLAREKHNVDCGDAWIQTYYVLGRYREALAEARKLYGWERPPAEAALLIQMAEEVLGALARGEQPRSESVRRVHMSGISMERAHLALWYTWAGDHEAALRMLETIVAERDPYLPFIKAPSFNPLRSEPRYRALVAKVGLPLSPFQ